MMLVIHRPYNNKYEHPGRQSSANQFKATFVLYNEVILWIRIVISRRLLVPSYECWCCIWRFWTCYVDLHINNIWIEAVASASLEQQPRWIAYRPTQLVTVTQYFGWVNKLILDKQLVIRPILSQTKILCHADNFTICWVAAVLHSVIRAPCLDWCATASAWHMFFQCCN